jgi:DNA integrity scanning protein DisA with diadenylate cyclase activity
MSYKERSTWISLAILVYIWFDYFAQLFSLQNAEQLTVEAVNSLLLAVVVKTIILEIVLQIVLAVIDHKDANYAEDERDKLISLHGSRNAYTILSVGVLFIVFHTVFPTLSAISMMPTHALTTISLPNEYKVMHIVIVFALIAEIAKFSTQLFFYRRGF